MFKLTLINSKVYSPQFIRFVSPHRAIGLQYYSEVGVNSFVTLQLSFLPEKESRKTHIVARSFCPEFEHHTDFCCQHLVQRDSGESVSLAEVLQEAMAIFTVYNRDRRKGEQSIAINNQKYNNSNHYWLIYWLI